MSLEHPPVVEAGMLIRRPVREVFEASLDPVITRRFWFTSGSGPLRAGTTVTWSWEMYGASAEVAVKAVERDHRIEIEWPTPVEWVFTPRGVEATLVHIRASGFTGSEDEQVSQALDSMGGFAYVLAGCKAFLEYGIELGLVADRDPDAHVPPRV